MDISKFALNAGELTDELAGRIDLGKIQMGLSVAENVRVLRVGGVTRRAGTGYIAPVFDETKKSRLEGFRFAENQGVCLEFAHNRMRVFKDAAIQDTLDLTESQTLTGTITPAAHIGHVCLRAADVNGAPAYGFNVEGATYPKTIISYSGTAWQIFAWSAVGQFATWDATATLAVAPTPDLVTTWSIGDGVVDPPATGNPVLTRSLVPTELVTPWTEDQVFALQFAQRSDGIIVTHPDVPTQFLRRDVGGFWSIKEFPWAERIWEINDDGLDITMKIDPSLPFSSFIQSFALHDFASDPVTGTFKICLVAHTPENSADGFILPNWSDYGDINLASTEEVPLGSYWKHSDGAIYKALVAQAAGGNDDPTEDPAKWELLAPEKDNHEIRIYTPGVEITAGSLIEVDNVIWSAEVNVTPTLEVGGYGGLPETGASWTEVISHMGMVVSALRGAKFGYLQASADIFTPDWVGTRVRLAHTRPESPSEDTVGRRNSRTTLPDDERFGTHIHYTHGMADDSYAAGINVHQQQFIANDVRGFGKYSAVGRVGDRTFWTVIADFDGPGGDYDGSLHPLIANLPDLYPLFFSQGIEVVKPQDVRGGGVFETFDTWTGTYIIERSYDAGVTWNPVKTLQSKGDKNFRVQEVERSDAGALFRVIILDFDHGSRSAKFTFTNSAAPIYGVVEILNYDSPTQAFVSIERRVESVNATSEWYEDALNPKNGYAKACTFHQGRLVFGGSHARPQSIWASRVRAPFDFTIGTLADDGLAFVLEAKEYESVHWLNSHLALLVGTSSGVWAIASPNGKSITAENNVTTKQISHGVGAGIAPISLQSNVLFLQNKGRKIQEISPSGSAEYGSYTGIDLTQLASHVTSGGVTQLAGGAVPDSSLYMVTGGEIALLTYERAENVVGWSRWITQGAFESVAICPGGGEDDDIYVTVKRGTRRFIERLTPDMLRVEESGDMVNLNFVDSSVRKVEVSEFTVMDGLDHLEGETVQVFADGEKKGDLIVTNGAVTAPHGVLNMIVGLGYDSTVTTMPLDQGQIGQKSAFTKAITRLRNSLGVVARVGDNTAESKIHITNPRITADAPLPLLSGDGEVTLHSSWTRSPTITLKQSDPLPMTILAIRMVSKTSP